MANLYKSNTVQTDDIRLKHIESIASAEAFGTPEHLMHVGLLLGSSAIAAWMFGTTSLFVLAAVYGVVFSFEKLISAMALREERPGLQPIVLGVLLARATTYNILVVVVWMHDSEVFKLAALALLVAATINIFVYHATYPAIIACVVSPIWLGFAALSVNQFLTLGFNQEPIASVVILLGVTPYFFLALLHTRRQWRQLEETRNALGHLQKQDVLGKLSSGVAHDFNNILGVTLGTAELIKGADPRERDELADQIIRVAQQGASLTNQLLSFSGEAKLNLTSVSLDSVLAEVEPLLARLMPQSISVDIKTLGSPPKVRLDRDQFKTAILNLATNSRDAMPKGGTLKVRVGRAGRPGQRFYVNGSRLEGVHAVLTITDDGNGIPEQLVDVVFQPFLTTKPHGSGSGLGLSMVKGFVSQSNGAIELRSTVGRGTTFKLFFPASEHENEEDHSLSRRTGAAIPKGKRALVVEDNQDLRRIAVNHLNSVGLRVRSVPDGNGAQELLLDGFIPDILLADLTLPGKTQGREVAEIVRRLNANVEVVFMTGYVDDLGDTSALEQGSETVLRKPFRADELFDVLRSELGTTD